MKANELRVGNFVKTPYGRTKCITVSNIQNYDAYKPIRIDHGILMRMGFDKFGNNFQINTIHGVLTEKPSKMVIRHTKGGNWMVMRPGNGTIFLNYLHELQNLYFALTGKELKIQ